MSAAPGRGIADLGAVGRLHEAAVEVGEVLRDQHGRHEGARDLGVGGPVLDLDESLAEVGHVDGVALGGDELRVVEDDRDLERRHHHLAVLDLRASPREGEDPVDDLERSLGVARELVAEVEPRILRGHGVEGRGRAPEGVDTLQEAKDLLDALVRVRPRRIRRLDPDAPPPVVADDHVEGLEHGPAQEVGQRDEGVSSLAVGRRHQVEDVAVENELARGAGLEDLAHLLRPGRELCHLSLGPTLTNASPIPVLLVGSDYPRPRRPSPSGCADRPIIGRMTTVHGDTALAEARLRADLDEVRRIVFEGLGSHPARVWLFGSRARGTAGRASDIDVAILPLGPLPAATLARIEETLDNSLVLEPRGARRPLYRRPGAPGTRGAGRHTVDELTRRLRFARRALGTLREVLAEPKNAITRDAAIQRFEYSFETSWKAVRLHLREGEGLDPGLAGRRDPQRARGRPPRRGDGSARPRDGPRPQSDRAHLQRVPGRRDLRSPDGLPGDDGGLAFRRRATGWTGLTTGAAGLFEPLAGPRPRG